MLSSFCLKNFKCFENTDRIKLSPITILVGPNNSGKSSVISALNILSLTSSSEDKNIYLKLLSKEYDYGTFKDISFNHSEDNIIEFSLIAPLPRKKKFIDIEDFIEGRKVKLILRYGYLKQRKEIYLESLSLHDNIGEFFNLIEDRYSKRINTVIRDTPSKINRKISSSCYKRGLVYGWRFNYEIYKVLDDDITKKMRIISWILDNFIECLTNIYHLGPLRMPPSRSYLFAGELTDRIGGTGERALLNYATLSRRRALEEVENIQKVNQALYKLGFLSKFEYRKVGERHYEYWTKHPESSFWANLADSGFGASQVLPVLILLFTCKQNSIIMIEQPELHLHPAAQAELGSVFVDASINRKIKTIIETHSETLILRLQTEVAKGNLRPKDITVYYVEPKESIHEFIELPLESNGKFINEWPRGFFEEGYLESIKLSKARGGKSNDSQN